MHVFVCVCVYINFCMYIVLMTAIPLGTKFQGNKQEKSSITFWDGKWQRDQNEKSLLLKLQNF